MAGSRFMMSLLQRNLLPIFVFLTGACVLIIEIVAVRVLSPHYGNTMFTVSSVISVILAALSVGYYIGGKLADKHPSPVRFFRIVLVSGLVVVAVHFLGTILLPILSMLLPLTSGPFISSLLLFLLPAVLLGTLSPYAVTLQSRQFPEQGIGTVSGTIFFWSTLGSITGSVLAGFVLIPHFGIDTIFIATGVVLFLLGFVPLAIRGFEKKKLTIYSVLLLILVVCTVSLTRELQGNVLYSKDGAYEKIRIYDTVEKGRPIRVFQQDKSASGALFLDTDNPTDLVYDYTKYYSLYKIFNPEVKNALVIGGGAYSVPRALLAELPEATIEVSEIEPALFELAQEYFDLEASPRLLNYTEDGRRFLRDATKEYDLIFSDVYYSLFSIPSHFTTQEFFAVAQERLSENGVFIANLIGDVSRQQPSLIFSEIKTFQSVFPNSYFFAVESPLHQGIQNIIFVGYNSSNTVDVRSPEIMGHENPLVSNLWKKAINLERYNLTVHPTFTDNFAPAEYFTAAVLRRTAETKPTLDGREMMALIEQQLGYGPRFMGSPGREQVQKFIAAEMVEYTHEVIQQSWDYPATDGKTYPLTNIIARLYPAEQQRIILATHYDTKKRADLDNFRNGEPVPGANDGASGVAVLMELARAFKNAPQAPNVGIDFVFFDGEEGDVQQGSDYSDWKPFGSNYFTEHLNALYGQQQPTAALVLDMVCDKDLKIYQEQSSVDAAPAFVDSFWNTAMQTNNDAFKNKVRPSIYDDHTALNGVGIPSFLVIDFDYEPFHTRNDTLDKCSSESLTTVAQAVFEYVYTIN